MPRAPRKTPAPRPESPRADPPSGALTHEAPTTPTQSSAFQGLGAPLPPAEAPAAGTLATPTFAGPYGTSLPWERQLNESDSEWSLFLEFRDWAHADNERVHRPRPSMAEWARVSGHSYSTLMQTSNAWGWRYRAGRYDALVDRARLEATLDARGIALHDHADLCGKLRRLLGDELEKYLTRSEGSPNFPTIKPSELAQLLKLCIEQERLLHGEATERVDHSLDGDALDLTKLSAEQIAGLETLVTAAGGKVEQTKH